MAWLMIFPPFRQVLTSVAHPTVYAVLMYLYFLLSATSCVYWTVKIGANGRGLFWIRPLPWIAIGLAAAALFIYLALFNDLTRQAGAGRSGLYYMTSSPLLFALVYCIFYPLITGGSLGVALKSIIAFIKNLSPDDSD